MRRMLKNIINEQQILKKDLFSRSRRYSEMLKERRAKHDEKIIENVPLTEKNFLINEDLQNIAEQLSKFTQEEKE